MKSEKTPKPQNPKTPKPLKGHNYIYLNKMLAPKWVDNNIESKRSQEMYDTHKFT